MGDTVPAGQGVDVQRATDCARLPDDAFLSRCAHLALAGRREAAVLTLRLVDEPESRELNRRWRGIDRPTNVLSFPMDGVEGVAPHLLGDIVICAPLVLEGARAHGKSEEAHWAHLVVHGVLHLLGFDHEQPSEAETMEGIERTVLASMGYADPYRA